MTRPRYETDDDLAGERKVAAQCALRWNCEARKTPTMYQVDWGLFRQGRMAAWLEIKRRKVSSSRYPTLILSAHKWDFGRRYAERFGIPFIIAVEYTDGIFYYVSENVVPVVQMGGREDRGDWQDMEPVIHLESALFKRLT